MNQNTNIVRPAILDNPNADPAQRALELDRYVDALMSQPNGHSRWNAQERASVWEVAQGALKAMGR